MRHFLTLIIISLFINTITAQEASWVHQIKSEGYDECFDLTTDNNSNVYICGQIEFLAHFDDGLILESAGIHDIFLAKFDSSGNRIWAKRAGSRFGGEKAHSIAVDASFNVYISGEIDDTSYFDNIQVIGVPANNTFVAKYDSDGNALWVRHFETSTMNSRDYAIACDAQGNVYSCGATQDNVIYNGNILMTTRGDYDAFVFKFDTNGNLIWLKQIGGTDSDKAYGIAVAGHDLYVTGYFAGSAQFSNSVTLNGFGGTDFFLAKYDTSGALQWAKQGGDTSFDRGWDVTVNTNGNIICTGEFGSQAHFGNKTVFSNGNMDMFLVAYNAGGNVLWAIDGGGVEDDIGRGVTHDKSGNIYVGGDYAAVASFPPYQVTSNGYSDAFLVSYDSSGNTRFIKSYGGTYIERGRGVGVDDAGNIYFSGEFNDSITFDNISIIGDTNLDIFIMQMKMNTTCSIMATASVDRNISCNGQCNGIATAVANGLAPYTFEWSTNPPQLNDTAFGLCQGNYVVTVTDAVGCTSSSTVNITEPASLIFNSQTVNDATCSGCTDGNILIDVTGGTTPYNFQWTGGNTSQNRFNLSAGNYYLCVQDFNNCLLCDSFTVSEPGNGITELNKKMFSVFPNPVFENLTIHFEQGLEINNWQLQLFNTTGSILKVTDVRKVETTISMEEISAGMYFLKLLDKKTGECIGVLPVLRAK